MADIKGTVFQGADNELYLFVFHDEVLVTDLTPLTRVVLILNNEAVVDSDAVGAEEVVWWTDTRTYTDTKGVETEAQVITLRLGLADLAEGEIESGCLRLFDADHPHGRVYTQAVQLTVVGCPAEQ